MVPVVQRVEPRENSLSMATDELNSLDIAIGWITISNLLNNRDLAAKGGAYYCYCAYVLRIWRCSGFPMGDAFKYSDNSARIKTIRRQ